MNIRFLLLFIIILLPSCTLLQQSENQKFADNSSSDLLVDLNISTKIIMTLIEKNELKKVLEEGTDQEGLNILIKNFSPAELAFEAEVLNHSQPVVVVFYKEENLELQTLLEKLRKLAHEYENLIKFVVVNAEELFKITRISEVDEFPTIIILHNRQEKERFEGEDAERNLEASLSSL